MKMEMLTENLIEFSCNAHDKNELFDVVGKMAAAQGVVTGASELKQALLNREAEATTGLMDGFAIPHAKSDAVLEPTIVYIRCANPLAWETMDNSAVTDVFALLVPMKNAGDLHLQLLSKLAVCLLDNEFKENVRSSSDKSSFIAMVEETLDKATL